MAYKLVRAQRILSISDELNDMGQRHMKVDASIWALYLPERFNPRRVADVSNTEGRIQYINIQRSRSNLGVDDRIASPFFEVVPNTDPEHVDPMNSCGFYSYEIGDVVKLYLCSPRDDPPPDQFRRLSASRAAETARALLRLFQLAAEDRPVQRRRVLVVGIPSKRAGAKERKPAQRVDQTQGSDRQQRTRRLASGLTNLFVPFLICLQDGG